MQAKRALARSARQTAELRAAPVVKVRDTSRDTMSRCKILKYCHFLTFELVDCPLFPSGTRPPSAQGHLRDTIRQRPPARSQARRLGFWWRRPRRLEPMPLAMPGPQ